MATHDLKQIWFNREINQRLEEVLRGIAASHLNIVENGMRFQNLKQDKKILRLANGIVIESSICFGKQTSRVYVPPVPLVKKKVVEEEEGLILIITREYDDEPLTRENMDVELGDVTGGLYVYEAVYDDDKGEWVAGEKIVECLGDINEEKGKWAHVEDSNVWTYTPTGYTSWACEYNYATNEWTINTDDKPHIKSSTGRYIVAAKFNADSIFTVYNRIYKTSEQGAINDEADKNECETLGLGRHFMTVPYYKEEYSSDINESGVTMFGSSSVKAVDGESKAATLTVWSTVPIKATSGLTKRKCMGTYYWYTNPWFTVEWGETYTCVQQPEWHGYSFYFWELPYGVGQLNHPVIEPGTLTSSADIEIYDGTNTYNFENRESDYTIIDFVDDLGTFNLGEYLYETGWINPPEPVPRDGIPPFRDAIETTIYAKITYNEVDNIPWVDSDPRGGLVCYNTAGTWGTGLNVSSTVTATYEDED